MYVYICWRCLIFVWIIVRGTDKSGTVKIFVLLEILVKKIWIKKFCYTFDVFFFNNPLDIFWSKENCKKKIKEFKAYEKSTWNMGFR